MPPGSLKTDGPKGPNGRPPASVVSFLDVGIPIPAFQMHENDRAINEVDRAISDRAQIVA